MACTVYIHTLHGCAPCLLLLDLFQCPQLWEANLMHTLDSCEPCRPLLDPFQCPKLVEANDMHTLGRSRSQAIYAGSELEL